MTNFTEFTMFEVEHGFGAKTLKGFVVTRIHCPDTIVLTQCTPDQAREIASHLVEAAARAEYEEDLWVGLDRDGVPMPEDLKGFIMVAVRRGEERRHQG